MELVVNNLSKSYNKQQVLQSLSFRSETSILGIAGANGAGKSTLLQIISGLLTSDSGSVSWLLNNGTFSPAEIRKKMGYSAPYVQLYDELTAGENIGFLAELHNMKDIDKTYILSLLNRFEAETLYDKYFGELSTGQQQRVKLAASVVHNPVVVCLDEPGSNLDEKGIRLIEQFVRKLSDNGTMVIIASNDAGELELCKQIIEL